MKMLSLLLLIAISAEAKDSIKISRIVGQPNAHPQKQFTYELSKNGKFFRCATQDVPPHKIFVKGLSLHPPKMPGPVPGCDDLVSWGGKSFCYEKRKNPMLDELFRQCVSL